MTQFENYFEKRDDGKDYLTTSGIDAAKKIYDRYSDKDIRSIARVSKNSLLNWISEKAISRAGMVAIKRLFIRGLESDDNISIKEDLSQFSVEELLNELMRRGFIFPFYNPQKNDTHSADLDNRKKVNESAWQRRNQNPLFKRLETERLILDLPEFNDDNSRDIFSVKEIETYLGRKVEDYHFEHYTQFLGHANGRINWAMIDKGDNSIIGFVIVHDINEKLKIGKISFITAEKYKGKGYIFESIKEILSYLFNDQNFRIISSACHENNSPSKKLLEKLGFSQRGKSKKVEHITFGEGVELNYSMKRGDWK